MTRGLYSLAWWLATPLIIAYLLWRARRQPEYLRHWPERWGLFRRRAGDAPLVWVHAVSVGETRAAQPLVAALLASDPELRLLLTHMTPTGRETGAELFAVRHGGRVIQAYLPYDYPGAPRRFLRAWRPALGIVMETELWPNLCAAAHAASVPLALVNARLSERSLRKGLRWRALTAPALRSLARVVAQTVADAQRIAALGRADVTVAGNLKFDVTPPDALLARGRAWKAVCAGRRVVLAASTRDGEEALILEAWRSMRAGATLGGAGEAAGARDGASTSTPGSGVPAPLLVIVPRHPQRFDDVAALVRRAGLSLARRSDFGPDLAAPGSGGRSGPSGTLDASPLGDGRADVLLGDSMGEMFAWYAMADVAIIGGSLLPFGAQNLIEACAAGTPVILGPSTYNFADAAEQAIAAGAARRVADAHAAVRASLDLIADDVRRARQAQDALDFAQAHRGATGRTMRALEPLLPRPARR